MNLYLVIGSMMGLMIGIFIFFIVENQSTSNSFLDKCWIRQQPKWIVHNKVYIIGLFLMWRGYIHQDISILIIGAAWIGLHLSQDLAERFHESQAK